jgi:EmrB/QacA subfamily drug resistance transporter
LQFFIPNRTTSVIFEGAKSIVKNIQVTTHLQSALRKAQFPAVARAVQAVSQRQTILMGLMIPFVMLTLNTAVFDVTLPTVRAVFQIQAEGMAWVMTVYNLPFMIATPLYGRLGDELGRRRLFFAGILAFLFGTIITMSAANLGWLMAGRAIQGLGSAGVVPLCIAMISELFPVQERGKAMGTWNSIGPVTNITGPLLAGFLIDYLNWRLVFGPVLLVSLAALWIVWKQVPPKQAAPDFGVLRRFDWGGVALLTAAVTALMFYLSSQMITGVATLRDWRLLSLALVLLGLFLSWERRQANPYISLRIFANKIFSRASICAALRMVAMSGLGFLFPLYLADIHDLSATTTGAILMTHAAALLLTMRVGGQLADRWSSRWPVTIGMSIQVGVIAGLALLPAAAPLWLIAAGLIGHGLSAGLSLAALHRASVGKVSAAQAGTAAGLYSMVRFMGTILGPALSGVLLQQGLDRAWLPIAAYQMAFWLIAGIVSVGILLGWGLQE